MIVFDSSTLILLARIDMLGLFISNYHGKVLIPEKVRMEVCAKNSEGAPLIVKLIEEKKIYVLKARNSSQIKKLMEDFNIDIGEAEALVLAIQEGINTVATDDGNTIKACKILKMAFVTAVAFLLRAFEKKLVEKDEALIKLQKLQAIGRYSKEIIGSATKQIKGGV